MLQLMPSAAIPMYYIGVPEDEEHKDWLNWYMKDCLAKQILDGTWVPAGVRLPPAEMPADDLVGLPPRPALSTL
eukprot:13551747-Alexandrium_andersonii.AAC.1